MVHICGGSGHTAVHGNNKGLGRVQNFSRFIGVIGGNRLRSRRLYIGHIFVAVLLCRAGGYIELLQIAGVLGFGEAVCYVCCAVVNGLVGVAPGTAVVKVLGAADTFGHITGGAGGVSAIVICVQAHPVVFACIGAPYHILTLFSLGLGAADLAVFIVRVNGGVLLQAQIPGSPFQPVHCAAVSADIVVVVNADKRRTVAAGAAGGGFGTAHLLYDFGGQIIGAHTAVFCGGQNRVGILGLAVVVLAGLAVGGQVVDPGIVHPGGGENGLHPGFGLLGIICGGFKLENMLLIKEVAGIHIVHHRVLGGRVPTGAFLGLVLAGGAAAVIGGRQRRLTLNQLLRVGGALCFNGSGEIQPGLQRLKIPFGVLIVQAYQLADIAFREAFVP